MREQLDIVNKEVEEIDVFQKRLTLVSDILKDHVYWTNYFSFLEKTILEDVTYSGSIGGSATGKYGFSATTDSFRTVENQVRVLRNNKLVKDVSVGSVAFSASEETMGIDIPTVNFSIAFELDETLLTLSKEEFNKFFLE